MFDQIDYVLYADDGIDEKGKILKKVNFLSGCCLYEILWGIIIKYKNTSTRFATSRERFWVIRRTLR